MLPVLFRLFWLHFTRSSAASQPLFRIPALETWQTSHPKNPVHGFIVHPFETRNRNVVFISTLWQNLLFQDTMAQMCMQMTYDAEGISVHVPVRAGSTPFPQRHASLSEVLKTYRLPLCLFPNRCQQLDLAFRLTPGVETFPNYMKRPQTQEKYECILIQPSSVPISLYCTFSMEVCNGRQNPLIVHIL